LSLELIVALSSSSPSRGPCPEAFFGTLSAFIPGGCVSIGWRNDHDIFSDEDEPRVLKPFSY
jgi:hypothetical protein